MLFNTRIDYYVTAACATLLLLFGTLLYLDFNRRVQAGGEQIGTLRQKYNQAQRKYTNQVIWEGLENEVPVFNKDSIRTGEYSSAVIELRDGTQIDLSENSMIVLNISEEAMDINFAYGSIAAKRGESSTPGEAPGELNIRSQDKVITIENSDVQLNQGDKGQALDVVVSRGEASISTESGETRTVGQDERASLSGAQIQVKKIALRPLGPDSGAQFFVDGRGTAGINFSWEAVPGNPRINLEVSRKRDFSEVAVRRAVNGTAAAAALREGTYYWRISARNRENGGQLDRSEVRTIKILRNSPLSLQAPARGSRFEFVSSPPLINFAWSENELARGYILEIASDSDFQNIVQSRQVQVRSTSLALDAGTYFWRVRTRSEISGGSTMSPVSQLQVVQREKVPPPVPLSPVRGTEIPAIYFEKEGVVFSWKRSADIRSINLQIASDASFRNVIVTRNARGNFTSVRDNLARGSYFWRLQGVDSAGQTTEYSDAQAFAVGAVEKIALLGPSSGITVDLDGARQHGLSFQWKKSEQSGTYELLISRDEKFAGRPAVKQQVTSNSSVVRLQETGRWFWKVRLLMRSGEVMTESETRDFEIGDTLAAPTPIFPAREAAIDLTNLKNLILRWQPGSGTYYEVAVRDARGRRLASARTNDASYVIADVTSLGQGRISWTVQACRAGGRCSPAMESSFTTTARNIPPPAITSDDTLYVIEE